MRNDCKLIPVHAQHGYILPFVLILLIILMFSSAAFFNRSTTSAEISGQQRDTTQALQLAESVVNRFTGRFTSGWDTATRSNINDINGDGSLSPDFKQIKDLIPGITNAPSGALPFYMYYVAQGAVTANSPVAVNTTSTILQAVADGESSALPSDLTINGQQVSSTTSTIKMNELFVDAARHPLLFVVDASGVPVASTAADWNAESAASGKAAVWVELVADTANQKMDIYAEAMAQVGSSKAYLQRRLGHQNYNNTLGSLVAPLSESGNRF